MSIAGLDIGTTGCKITIYDDKGIYHYRAYRDYKVERGSNVHEVNAEHIWRAVQDVITEAAKHYTDIRAIGITSFGETFVMLDKKNQPIRPAILDTDPRGALECEKIVNMLGKDRIAYITGLNPHSMYGLPKMMWMKEHAAKDYNKAEHILMIEDFVVYMLTGNAMIDYSLATRSMAFDIRTLEWSEEILKAAGIDKGLFSKPVISGTNAGTVQKNIAEKLGLTEKTIIVPVGHDQVAAAIGAGVFSSDCAVDGAGTVECVTPVFDGIPENKNMQAGNYAIVPYVIEGKYVTYAFSFTGGALVQWYIDNLAKWEKAEAKDNQTSVYEILEKNMIDEPTKILVLPHFAGAATPYMDEGSKGAIVGLTVSHTASDLYRAMMEGVVYEMRLNIELLEEAGIEIKTLKATGGGAASRVWMQMKADILNIPVISLGSSEAGATGCAIMAGLAIGIFNKLEHAAEYMIHEKETYYPREEMYRAYSKEYEKYKKLYKAVRELV